MRGDRAAPPHTTHMALVSSFFRKDSPRSFSRLPSTCWCHDLPSRSCTRCRYVSSCLEICRAQMILPDTGGRSRTMLRRAASEPWYLQSHQRGTSRREWAGREEHGVGCAGMRTSA